jgi:alpha-L-arabinofuranosidase
MNRFLLLISLGCLLVNVSAQTSRETRLTIDLDKKTERISPLLFGQFIEFLGRCIDGGIYEEGSPLSDKNGFRADVLEKVKELNIPLLRFPGGTVVKNYHWKDGIGAKADRPRRKNLIWGGINDNHFGTAEFIQYCRDIGAEPFLVVNMSTGTAEEASEWVEYCNGTEDTYYANLRRSHGYEKPFNVRYWGIGNEENAVPDAGKDQDVNRYIEESWQFIKLMKLQDPNIKITLVGHPDDLVWSRKVISEMNPVCDYLSVHFYSMPPDDKFSSLLSSIENFSISLDSIRKVINEAPTEVKNFSQWYRFPSRQEPVKIAIDEWGIWDIMSGKGTGTYNMEYQYNWEQALAVGKFYNIFQRNADIIGLATWAQTVNVLAPIMTRKNGLYLQTVYTPIYCYRKYTRDNNIPVEIDSPSSETAFRLIDATASISEDKKLITISLLNLSETDPVNTTLLFNTKNNIVRIEFSEQVSYTAPSLEATNSFDRNSVKESRNIKLLKSDNGFRLHIEPASINFIVFKISNE